MKQGADAYQEHSIAPFRHNFSALSVEEYLYCSFFAKLSYGNKGPIFHPHLDAHSLIIGDRFAPGLGQSREDRRQHLAGELGRVDVLFLKAHAAPQALQLPSGCQTVRGIPCEPGDRLAEDPVNQPSPAVRQKPLELCPFL